MAKRICISSLLDLKPSIWLLLLLIALFSRVSAKIEHQNIVDSLVQHSAASSASSSSSPLNNNTLQHSLSPGSLPKLVSAHPGMRKHHTHHVHHYPHHYRAHYHTNQRIQWAPRTATGQLAANATRAVTNMVTNVNHAIHSFFHARPKSRSSAAGTPFFKLLTGESIISSAASKLFPSASKLLQARKSDNEQRRFIAGVVAIPAPTSSLPSLPSGLGKQSLSLFSLPTSPSQSPSVPSSSPLPSPSLSSSSSSSSLSSLFDSHRMSVSESVVNEVTVNATEQFGTNSTNSGVPLSTGNNHTNEAAINLDKDGDRLRDEIVGRVSNLQTALTHAIEFSKDRREYISNKLLEQTNLRLEQAKERTHRFLSDPRNQEMAARAIHSVNTGVEKANNWFQGIMARVGQTILERAAQRVQQQKAKQENDKKLDEARYDASKLAGNSIIIGGVGNSTLDSTTPKPGDK